MTSTKSPEESEELGDQELAELYIWIDDFPLSRPKRNMARDFSDGVLVAELIKHLFPKLIDLHNYCPCNATEQKMRNWVLLNRKVFSKLNFELPDDVIRQIVTAKPGVIERVLSKLRIRLDWFLWAAKERCAARTKENERPEADQNSFGKMSSRKDVKGVASRGTADVASTYIPHKGSKAPQDETVPLLLLEEKEQEVLAKNETIQILQAKIKRLEHLLHLKDIRIEDLQSRLESHRATGKR